MTANYKKGSVGQHTFLNELVECYAKSLKGKSIYSILREGMSFCGETPIAFFVCDILGLGILDYKDDKFTGEINKIAYDEWKDRCVANYQRVNKFMIGSVGVATQRRDLCILRDAEEAVLLEPEKDLADCARFYDWRIVQKDNVEQTISEIMNHLNARYLLKGIRPDFRVLNPPELCGYSDDSLIDIVENCLKNGCTLPNKKRVQEALEYLQKNGAEEKNKVIKQLRLLLQPLTFFLAEKVKEEYSKKITAYRKFEVNLTYDNFFLPNQTELVLHMLRNTTVFDLLCSLRTQAFISYENN
ncbi:MAG: hypothetical protein QXT19_04635 [Candidatus Woesearchaeota archaeon]